MKKLLIALLLVSTSAWAQQTPNVNVVSVPDRANRVVCVNPTTHALESCGGGSSGGGAVDQGTAAATTDAAAWPIKVVFGNAHIDPRAIRTLTTGDAVTASLAAGSVIRIQDGSGNAVSSTAGALWHVIRDAAGNARGANVTAGNALVVDGSAVTQPVSAASLPLPSGASTAALQTQPGVDIGDVTVNNAAGVAAVNVQDGGNSLTVDGTVTVTDGAGALNVIVDSGTLTAVTSITNAVTVTDGAGALNTIVDSGTLTAVTTVGTVTNVVHVDDNAGSLTVDGTVTVTDGAGALNVIVDSGTLTAVTGITNAVTVTDGAGALNTIVDSGSITANAGTNLNTSALALEATQSDVRTSVQLIDNAISGAGFNITQFAGVNAASGSGTAAGALRVELPTNGTGVVGLNAGAAIVGKVGIDQTTPGTTNKVTVGSDVVHTIVDSGAITTTPSTDVITNLTKVNSVALNNPYDMNTGAGTENVLGVVLRQSSGLGSNELGTSSFPLRVDTVNTTAQSVVQTAATNLNAAVQGPVASGATKSGGPVQGGGVFNTTQPTVTTGQVVEAQYTNRGAAIVANGVEAFSVTANAGTNLNTSALALEATQLTGNTSLASVKTNTDPLVTAAAGGYVRQDSTATIARESGGNLATIATNTTGLALEASQLTGNSSLASVAAATHLEDAAAADGDRGMLELGQRRDVAGTQTTADGDYEALQLLQGWLRVLASATKPDGTARPLVSDDLGNLRVTVNGVFGNGIPGLFLKCNALRRVNCK